MSKAKWGAGMSLLFGLIANVAPIPETWRWIITGVCGAGLLICLIGYLRAHGEYSARPLVVALNKLKALLGKGERMLARYYVPEALKPGFKDYNSWQTETRDCASQNALAEKVNLSDLNRLEDRSPDKNYLLIKAKFADAGYLANLTATEIAVFDALLMRVERLKELVAKIEGEESTTGHFTPPSAVSDMGGFPPPLT